MSVAQATPSPRGRGQGAALSKYKIAGEGQWRPLLALALLTLIWGFSVPVMKLGLAELPPLALVSLRYVGAAPFFALFLIGRRLPPPRALGAIALLAALGLGAGQILQIIGVQRTSAAVATIILATIPIFTVVLAVMRLRQTLHPRHAAGLIVALIGIGLTTASTSNGTASFTTVALTGDACLLLSSVCIAAYYVLGVELAIGQGVMLVSAWSTIFGAMFLSPLALWEIANGRVHWSFAGIGTLAYLSLLVTVLGIWIWLHALHALPARIAASSQYVQPLIGVLASAGIFGTPLGAGFALGSALVLGGVALCSLSGPQHD
jgi:O-acetylserine/cysteine efflux transporter